MQKKYQLKINNACQENWAQMQESQVGKYCSVCTKHVVDFTELSDDELIELIEKSTGQLCGRFRESQLNRILVQTQYQERSTRFQQILAGLLLVSTMGIAHAGQDNQLSQVQLQTKATTSLFDGDGTKNPSIDSTNFVLKGKLLLPDSTILANAKIQLFDSESSTMSNDIGYFELEIPFHLIDSMYFEVTKDSLSFYFSVDKRETAAIFVVQESETIQKSELMTVGMIAPQITTIEVQDINKGKRKKSTKHAKKISTPNK